MLDPDTVERFASGGLPSGPSRATYRADLRRMRRRLTKTAPWEPKPEVMARRHVAAPYSERELDELRRAADRQSTAAQRRAATALVVLGAGAGVDGRWSTRVAAADVDCEHGGLTVRVRGPMPRAVPVLRRFEDDLLELVSLAGAEYLVGGLDEQEPS